MTTIPIAEIFGPTLQGEGSLAGRPTYFVRVGGCDFKCAWCDTGYAVNVEEVRKLPRMTQDEIIERLLAHRKINPGPTWLSISGGNPALYELGDVVFAWQRTSPDGGMTFPNKVTVETQGSIWKDWLGRVDVLTISPKPPSSTMVNGEAFADFMHKAAYAASFHEEPWSYSLKVIVFDDKDYAFAQNVHKAYPHVPFYLSVGTAMGGLSGEWAPPDHEVDRFEPERDTPGSLMRRWRWLAEKVAADPLMADAAIFPQTHVLIWGINKKGI